MTKAKKAANSSRKRGSKRNEMAVKHRKEVHNFKQSKDIHEDRGTMQKKFSSPDHH